MGDCIKNGRFLHQNGTNRKTTLFLAVENQKDRTLAFFLVSLGMFKNYLKTAWRNLKNNKVYSAINILGLSAGMAVALLIGLWVYNEYSYDRFLPGYQQLYQVRRNFDNNGEVLNVTSSSLKLADALRSGIPGIAQVAETDWMGSHGLMVGNKKFYISGGQTASDFLEMFQYPLLEGNASLVLKDPYSIVLTESTARTLFGNEDPINKTVRFDNKNDLKVTGVLKDLPANSSFRFNFLVPFSYYEQTSDQVKQQRAGDFTENSYQIFVQLKPGISYAQVASGIKDIEKGENSINAKKSDVVLQPLQRWHLYSNYVNGKDSGGFIEYVRIFSIIGMLVLMIACINFINLTTARSEKRAREVGVRKVIGSRRKDLIFQFLTESFLLTSLAFLLSLLLVQFTLPAFNLLTGNELHLPVENNVFWFLMTGYVLLIALVAGSRPAFYLSSFNPAKVLKGSLQAGRAASLPRKILVVLQFSCSIALIISTLIIYQQIKYAQDRPTGYPLDRLMMTDMNSDLERNYTILKNELLQKGIAESVTQASGPATTINWHSNVDWPGKGVGETAEMGKIIVREDYFSTMGIPILSGRDFAGGMDSTGIIFNEAAIKRMRLKEPIGQIVTQNGTKYRILGVVKDVLMASPFAPAEPTMFFCQPGGQSNLLYRLSPAIKTSAALVQLTALFNKYSPAYPYGYEFADQSYAGKFNQEVLVGKLSGIFASLAIFISCLGLFGLAAYTAEQRTKEIGIRKVLGASVPQLWLMLSKDFMVLVLISCLIASPLAFYFLQGWLQQYDYRISIGPAVFLGAGTAAMIITIVTISFQSIKAALSNPVKSLKSE
jgi:putative ABC transport system permease protein